MSIAKSAGSFFLDIIETVVVALSIFLVIYLFFVQPHQVKGQSMENTFHTGDYLLTDKVSYHTGQPHRGDVVIFHAPEAAGCVEGTGCDFIKRVIGLPGDQIQVKDGGIYVNGTRLQEPYLDDGIYTEAGDFTRGERQIVIGPTEYFLVGDNRPHSHDSRAFGPVPRENIVGRVFLRYLPLDQMGIIPRVSYQGINAGSVFSTTAR